MLPSYVSNLNFSYNSNKIHKKPLHEWMNEWMENSNKSCKFFSPCECIVSPITATLKSWSKRAWNNWIFLMIFNYFELFHFFRVFLVFSYNFLTNFLQLYCFYAWRLRLYRLISKIILKCNILLNETLKWWRNWKLSVDYC